MTQQSVENDKLREILAMGVVPLSEDDPHGLWTIAVAMTATGHSGDAALLLAARAELLASRSKLKAVEQESGPRIKPEIIVALREWAEFEQDGGNVEQGAAINIILDWYERQTAHPTPTPGGVTVPEGMVERAAKAAYHEYVDAFGYPNGMATWEELPYAFPDTAAGLHHPQGQETWRSVARAALAASPSVEEGRK